MVKHPWEIPKDATGRGANCALLAYAPYLPGDIRAPRNCKRNWTTTASGRKKRKHSIVALAGIAQDMVTTKTAKTASMMSYDVHAAYVETALAQGKSHHVKPASKGIQNSVHRILCRAVVLFPALEHAAQLLERRSVGKPVQLVYKLQPRCHQPTKNHHVG